MIFCMPVEGQTGWNGSFTSCQVLRALMKGKGVCELFAVSAAAPVDVSRYLHCFFQHSVRHPHGWGVSWQDRDKVVLHKEPVRAIDSAFARELVSHPVTHAHLLAHIRLATCGRSSYENCHPFVHTDYDGLEWMMVHNGTIFNDALITGYDRHETGDTDSERIILFLTDLLNTAELRYGNTLDFEGRFEALNNAIVRLSNGNKLNIILDDGENLYVHTNTMSHTLYMKRESGATLFSTQALDDSTLWQPVPTAQLQVYRAGELVRQAPAHSNIFMGCAPQNYLLLQTSA